LGSHPTTELTDAGGPRVFGVKFKKDGSVVLVERGEPVCGEAACAEGKELEAILRPLPL
jgi:hypothetical protein